MVERATFSDIDNIKQYNLLEKTDSREGFKTVPQNSVNVAETAAAAAETEVSVFNNPTKESKEKESKESLAALPQSSPPPNNSFSSPAGAGSDFCANAPAAPQENMRAVLISQYGESNVADYEERYRKWLALKGRTGSVNYTVISRWLKEDGVFLPEPDLGFPSSFDVEDIMKQIRAKYE